MPDDSSNLDILVNNLKNLKHVIVAYSGGVDSTFLLAVAKNVLGDKAIAVTEDSMLITEQELQASKKTAACLDASHIIIKHSGIDNDYFRTNPANRCYFCKKDLFKKIKEIALEHNAKIVDGTNLDDFNDYRPGIKAADEMGVSHPLADSMFTKQKIRTLSKKMQLPTWNKESTPCLASRFAYGLPITKEYLGIIEKGEDYLRSLGFVYTRIRLYENNARIEVAKDQVPALFENKERILKHLKELGLDHVTLDHSGYRQGSMNMDRKNSEQYETKRT